MTSGGAHTVAVAGGRVILVGDGADAAAAGLAGLATHVLVAIQPGYAPGRWADALAGTLAGEDVVVLPASADGRDLAPRLAHRLGYPLLAGAVEVRTDGAVVARRGGLVMEDLRVDGPFVVTLDAAAGPQGTVAAGTTAAGTTAAGTAAAGASTRDETVTVERLELDGSGLDPTIVAVLAADPATIDLGEATRVVAAGAGVGSADAVARVGSLATALGASLGATRVVTDLGWAPAERQIGTTGVTVDPDLYLAVGISGAVQHVTGIGEPAHIVAVNTDPSCPMMAMADLAMVTDGPAFVDALSALLAGPAPPAGQAVRSDA